MENVDMEVAADFIQMASYLIYLKSKMLLPRQFAIEEGVDPEEEKFIFTQRLVEYSFYKDMAMLLKEKEFFAQRYLYRGAILSLPVSFMPEDPYRLASAFFNLFERHREDITTVVKDTVDIEEIVKYLSALIEQEKELLWDRLKKLASSRREAVVFFLAVLELVKQRIVTVIQSQNFDNFVVIHNG
jgi:segregation and condensation protein A